MARLETAFAALALAAVTSGCGGARYPEPGTVTFIDGQGRAIDEDEVARRMSTADVALVGEIHGHPAGLELARRLFDRVASSAPSAALSLEFVERDQQPALDAYVAGEIDEAELAQRRGGAKLPAAHLAMIDRARAARMPVIAANAPRRFARQARLEGWDALRALPEDQRGWLVIPEAMPSDAYRSRFADAMGMGSHGDDAHGPADTSKLDGFYRAQVLWDATMADAIRDQLERGRAPIVHVVGGFHVEHDGGLAELVRRAAPKASVFTLVMSEEPAADDRGRADAIAFVGAAPEAHP
jgi:uncharacterized iron-regulated protein